MSESLTKAFKAKIKPEPTLSDLLIEKTSLLKKYEKAVKEALKQPPGQAWTADQVRAHTNWNAIHAPACFWSQFDVDPAVLEFTRQAAQFPSLAAPASDNSPEPPEAGVLVSVDKPKQPLAPAAIAAPLPT